MAVLVRALAGGFRSLLRNPGLVLVVLASNLLLALVAAIPLAAALRQDLVHRGASIEMMYGFDYGWWSRFDRPGSGFAPDLIGVGFALRNLDLLLRGALPGGLFSAATGVDPLLLGLAGVYWLLQVFLAGGLLAVLRAPAGGWTFRSLVHGSAFYFARLLRVAVLAVAAAGVLFAVYDALAGWTDELAHDAVSERTALALVLGRQVLLLGGLLVVHMISSYAKVILVCEERRSALLAATSAAGFCVRNLLPAVGQYAFVALAGALLLALFAALDGTLEVTGWKSQLLALVVFQAFVALRIGLRLSLLAAQLELQQAYGRPQA